MELHYKCSVWCTIKFNEEVDKQFIIDKLNSGMLPLEVAYANEGETGNVEWEVLTDTEQFIPSEENDGQSTIELMEHQLGTLGMQCIWDNSFESEIKRKQNGKQ